MYHIKNPVKYLKLFKKEGAPYKTNYSLELFSKDTAIRLTDFEYVSVLNMPRIQNVLNMSECALE